MQQKNLVRKAALLASVAFGISVPQLAFAQTTDAAAPQQAADSAGDQGFGDIVVTARKREETLNSVPVVVNAFTGANLNQRGITSVDSLARIVPGLISGDGGSTIQGGTIALRGISGVDNNPLASQSVSFTFDGVQVARSSVRRFGDFDVQQTAVLKGPQALFFGKDSPAGVISITTADPTPNLSASVMGGYEFRAREKRVEAYVAGPLTDTLGFRIAGYYSGMDGWSKTIVPATSLYQPRSRRSPDGNNWALRGTLKYEPNDKFSLRAKFTYGEVDAAGPSANTQFVNCPLGRPQNGSIDECKANEKTSIADIGPGLAIYDAREGNGKTYIHQKQSLGGLEMNFHPTETLTLTALTGYYDVDVRTVGNYTTSYIPGTILQSPTDVAIRELSQELRLASSFEGMFNFIVGGYYQRTNSDTSAHSFLGAAGVPVPIFGNVPGPVELNEYYFKEKGRSASIFAQLTINILPTLELSGGARYTKDRKTLPILLADLNPGVVAGAAFSRNTQMSRVTPLRDRRSFTNTSPEATLTWRPSREWTVFGSYKKGFLSGGFNGGATALTADLTYGEETIKGTEFGVKSDLFGGKLRTSLAYYNYKVSGLQVAVLTNAVVSVLTNAGGVRTKGVDFDFDYQTPVSGLSIHGAAAYLDGKYTSYFANCYRGLSAPACVLRLNPLTGSTGLSQDLSGTELVRAPEWTGNLGFTYQGPISSALRIALTGNASYSDGYFTDASSSPGGRVSPYTLFDGTIALSDTDKSWELALIGRNLTNKFYWSRTIDAPFTGTAPGNAPGTPTILGDSTSSVSRGREIWLRATYRFN